MCRFLASQWERVQRQSVVDRCGLEQFDAKVLSLHKILKCAVDMLASLCLELQLVIQAPLTIFQQSTWGMKNSVAREEQRQVRKPDTGLTVT